MCKVLTGAEWLLLLSCSKVLVASVMSSSPLRRADNSVEQTTSQEAPIDPEGYIQRTNKGMSCDLGFLAHGAGLEYTPVE